MNEMLLLVPRGRLTAWGAWILLLAASSLSQASTGSPDFAYCVGVYGYLQKMDTTLNTLSTRRIPNLARDIRIVAADISPDGKRLFVATSRRENPLVIVETADLSVVSDGNIAFPGPTEPWIRHAPFDIMAVSPDVLYWSDECYTSAIAGDSFSTLLVDLREKVAKPIRDWNFENRSQIEVSPDRDRMVLLGRGLSLIHPSTGHILKTVGQEVIGQRTVLSFNMDWSRNILQCCVVPWTPASGSVERLRIDVNSGQVVTKEPVKNPGNSRFAGLQTKRQRATRAMTYVLDKDGTIEVFDNAKCELLRKIRPTGSDVKPESELALYVPPGENSILVQEDTVKTLADGSKKDVSSLQAVDPNTGQTTKTVDCPDEIVAVLFGK
jgi:hypothetical protein